MKFGFALKHIQASRSNGFLAQGLCQRGVVHNAAACNVDQRGRGLHEREFGRPNGVVRLGRIRQHQHQVICRFEPFLLADVAGLAVSLGGGVQGRTVMVNNLHAKTVRTAAGNALPYAAHTQNAQGTAVYLGAGEHVVAPFGPLPSAQEMLRLGHAPGRGHQQRKAEVGGGFSQHIGRVAGQHACGGHGRYVKVVETHGHVGANFELRAGGQQGRINALAPSGEGALLTLEFFNELGRRPQHIGLVGGDREMLGQFLQHFREDSASDED